VVPTKRLRERPASPLHQPGGGGLVARTSGRRKKPRHGGGLAGRLRFRPASPCAFPKGLAADRRARRWTTDRERGQTSAASHGRNVVPSRWLLCRAADKGRGRSAFAGRVVPAVDGVGVVGHTRSGAGQGYILPACHPADPAKTPRQTRQTHEAQVADRADAHQGRVARYVDATDAQAAETVAAEQFRLDGWQRRRLLVWELG
jgi:hypothetical protein